MNLDYTKKERQILNRVRRLQTELDALAPEVEAILAKDLRRQGYVEFDRHPSKWGEVVYWMLPRSA